MSSAERAAALVRVLDMIRDRRPKVTLIDGPSGAGKSTMASELVDVWPAGARPTLVRLDDIYPGWNGLDAAGAHVARYLLAPLRHGGEPTWQRHDWVSDSAAEWHRVDPAAPLIVEGCGVLTRENEALADLTIWLTAGYTLRKRRALGRDAGAFDAHWDDWQRQFDGFVDREHPQSLADLTLDGSAWE